MAQRNKRTDPNYAMLQNCLTSVFLVTGIINVFTTQNLCFPVQAAVTILKENYSASLLWNDSKQDFKWYSWSSLERLGF